jgi:hypothetical protein
MTPRKSKRTCFTGSSCSQIQSLLSTFYRATSLLKRVPWQACEHSRRASNKGTAFFSTTPTRTQKCPKVFRCSRLCLDTLSQDHSCIQSTNTPPSSSLPSHRRNRFRPRWISLLPCTHQFVFLQGLDQYGYDAGLVSGPIEQIMYRAYIDNKCVGFNTFGYLKKNLSCITFLHESQSQHGIFIKKSAIPQVVNGTIPLHPFTVWTRRQAIEML